MTNTFLHVGCGPTTKRNLKGFSGDDWSEIRLDIDPRVSPDIVGSLTDMSAVASGSVSAVFSSHNIEHLYPFEVPVALAEFRRVLREDGFLVLTCPDLQSVCEAVANDQLVDPLYTSPAGPIAAIDILYGHRSALAQGNLYMAHRCGFTYKVLDQLLQQAGFTARAGMQRRAAYDLWMLGSCCERSEAELLEMAKRYFP